MLLLSLERDVLLKPLTMVGGFIEKKHTMPILSNVYIKKQDNQLTIIANDLEIQACITITQNFAGEDFVITLPQKKLQEILRVIPEGTQISLTKQNNKILITSGAIKYTIQSLPADSYPLLKVSESEVCTFHIPQIKLKQMLWQIQYAMADKDGRVFLNGMLFETNDNQLKLVATDAHRLGLTTIDLSPQKFAHAHVILPKKSVLELFRLLDNNENLVTVKIFPNQVYFECDNRQLLTKIIDGKYPSYERVIPITNDKICIINRVQLLNAVERVSVIGSDKVKTLTAHFFDNKLSISCTNEDDETSQDEIEVVYDNVSIQMTFNLLYVRDLLNNSTAEFLQFALFDDKRSILVTVPEQLDFMAVLMPLRI